jgi:hypothetical protein
VQGDTITARWTQTDYKAVEITPWPSATLNGVIQAPDPDFLQGRAVIKSEPLTLANRVLSVNIPSGKLEVNWQGSMPVFSSENYRASYSRRFRKPQGHRARNGVSPRSNHGSDPIPESADFLTGIGFDRTGSPSFDAFVDVAAEPEHGQARVDLSACGFKQYRESLLVGQGTTIADPRLMSEGYGFANPGSRCNGSAVFSGFDYLHQVS